MWVRVMSLANDATFFDLDPEGAVAIVGKWREPYAAYVLKHHSNFEMERQLASLDLTHVLCESQSMSTRSDNSLIVIIFPQMTQIPICLLGWPS